jgi:hypothetical protein
VILDGSGQAITPLHPAAPNQTVTVWGTGLGPIPGDETLAPPLVDMPEVPVEVYVGTAKADVSYRGRAGYAGVDQINFQIPTGQIGCQVAVAIKIGSVVSNFTTLAVSASGPCSDPNGIPASALDLLSAKGSLNSGGFALQQTTLPPGSIPGTTASTTSETGVAGFSRQTLAAVTQSPISSFPSIGGCSVQTFSSDHPYIPTPVQGLDAGPSISLSGPNGNKQLPNFVTPGNYLALLSQPPGPLFISPGTFTFTGTGGADVGALTATSIVGPRVKWLNEADIPTPVSRSQDLTVTWSGGPPNGYALISGSSIQVSGTTRYQGIFYCLAPIAAGQFTVPSVVLLALPPTSVVPGGTNGFLAVGSLTATIITPPPGLDLASTSYMEETQNPVTYK